MKHNFEKFCKDYENIENYYKAAADNFKGWECHHRLETHTSDGKRREVDILAKELKALDMYYDRPSEELIFLPESEHKSLRKVSDSTREKLRAAKKGEKNPMYGKHLSDESKNKLSEARKGIHFTEEHKNKLSEAKKGHPVSEETKKKIGELKKGNTNTKGKHWYNNGKINIMSKECPEGFVTGMLRI